MYENFKFKYCIIEFHNISSSHDIILHDDLIGVRDSDHARAQG